MLFERSGDPRLVHGLLMQWSALSVQLQEPCERLLVSASHRCGRVDEHPLAMSLLYLASEAIDRYRIIADDARLLTQLWNQRHEPHLDHTALLTQPSPESVRRLLAFFDALVASDEPWAVLAAIHELDAMVVAVAPLIVGQVEGLLGDEYLSALRTLASVSDLDQQPRTQQTLDRFLERFPARLDPMVAAGSRTLDLYANFLADCSVAALNLAGWRRQAHG